MKLITGQKFNKLTALEVVDKSRYGYIWKCRCECGNITKVNVSDLTRGNTKSCGCLRRTRLLLPKSQSNFRHLYVVYKASAMRRGLSFELDEFDFKNITSQDCYYCGIGPKQVINQVNTNGSYFYNGIDRINNSVGYIKNNVVPCCKVCNYAKKTMSETEFLLWIKRVYEFRHLNGV